MRILGYSERGLVNSLFFEIAYSQNSELLLYELLSISRFPFLSNYKFSVSDAVILVEQSFSDFGDADSLLLITSEDKSSSVFIEAKVKPFQKKSWSIEDEFDNFINGTKSKVSSSNLFTQLYHKVRLVTSLRQSGMISIQKGIPFPSSSSKQIRKIGNNQIVLNATKALLEHLDDTLYLAIVPDDRNNLETFYKSGLLEVEPEGYLDWDVSPYGYTTWADVESYCRRNQLENTLSVFEHNQGQIY